MRNTTKLRTIACYAVMLIALAIIFVELRSGMSPTNLVLFGAIGYYAHRVRVRGQRLAETRL